MSTRIPFIGVVLCAIAAAARPDSKVAEPSLATLPARVFRIDDAGKFQTESWYFELVVRDGALRDWEPRALKLEMLSGGAVLRTDEMEAPHLASLRRRHYFPTDDMAKTSMRRHFSIPDEVFDLPLVFRERRADAVDHVRATLTLKHGKRVIAKSILVPIERYVQKTRLVFPFKGPGIVTQGHFNDGGHAHRQTLFALDVMGLTPTYAPMLNDEETNQALAGWGRDVIAPAAGTVAYARNDVPANPLYAPDETAYSALPEPVWAIAGNCVVIDHGNGEFSAMMHMQQGSVTVRKGESVQQGQVIGKLGNSGDSFMPHLHYQLANGALIFASDGLPVRFDNLPGTTFTRGTYFEAK